MVGEKTTHWVNTILVLALVFSVFLIPAPAKADSQSLCTQTHTVVWGETLYQLAIQYGVTVSDLMSWNGLWWPWIYAGQVLCVSHSGGGKSCHQYHKVHWGDTLTRIGAMYGQSWYTIWQWNRWQIWNPNWIFVGQVFCVSYY